MPVNNLPEATQQDALYVPPRIPENFKATEMKGSRKKTPLPMWYEEEYEQADESPSEDAWLDIDSSDNNLVNVNKAQIGFSSTLTISRKRISEADLEAEILSHFKLNDLDSVLFDVDSRYVEKFCHWGVCGGEAFVSSLLKMHQKSKLMRKLVKKPIVEALS